MEETRELPENMRLLILGQHYAPEEVSGAVLATELVEDLVAQGNEVTLVTPAPSYPAGVVYRGYRNRVILRGPVGAVHVVRTWSYISPRKTFWRRLLNYGTFSATAFLGSLTTGRPDAILSFSPPLPLGVSAWLLSRLWRVPWILYVGDIYPEIAVVTGVLRNRTAIVILSSLERFLYRHATHIQVLSEGFRRNLIAKGVPDQKISVTPVWGDEDAIRPMRKDNAFREQQGLSGRFVVLYAGNLGFNSSVEDVVDAAALLREDDDIVFLLVGEGVKKQELVAAVQRQNLKNTKFLPFQPRSDYPAMLAASDVHLVTLSEKAHYTSMPSKTFNIMASGRPILAITPLESELARLVQEERCGVVVTPGDCDSLAKAILAMRQDTRRTNEMGANGRRCLEEKYSRKKCTLILGQDLQKALAKDGSLATPAQRK